MKFVPYVVLALAIAAGFAYFVFLSNGTLLLLPEAGHGYRVEVDGKPVEAKPEGKVLSVSIPQGKHHLRIQDEKGGGAIEHDIDVKQPAHPYVASVTKDQCFLELDFTDFYGKDAKSVVRPLRDADKHLDGKPFQTSRETRFATSELPKAKREHMPQFVLKSVSCTAFAKGEVNLEHLLDD